MGFYKICLSLKRRLDVVSNLATNKGVKFTIHFEFHLHNLMDRKEIKINLKITRNIFYTIDIFLIVYKNTDLIFNQPYRKQKL